MPHSLAAFDRSEGTVSVTQGIRRLDASGIHALGPQVEDEQAFRALVALMLAAGGDRRIWPDAATGRNKYGTRTRPVPDEIEFSSTTASNVSAHGFAAAEVALRRLFGMGSQRAANAGEWFGDIRGTIARQFGSEGAEVILAASGTDVELVALCLAATLTTRPITNIFIAPDETGNGVPLAAGGHHFSEITALGVEVEAAAALEGLAADRIRVRTVAIRRDTGEPRDQRDIDQDLIAAVEAELAADRDVLVHVLDISKTGLTGVTREAARHIAGRSPGRVRIVIDACQLRSPISRLRDDLSDGFLVAVTGSKFAAGPPFAGALIIPAVLVQEIAAGGVLPAGIGAYTAACDWPDALRDRMGEAFKSEMNIGLGLRWVAASANLVPYVAAEEQRHALIKECFANLVKSRARDLAGAVVHADDDGGSLAASAIVPLTVLDLAGRFASFAEAQRLQFALRSGEIGPVCHVGQPVRVGPRAVLRVGASAIDIASVSERMDQGQSLDRALEPLIADLDALFAKWSRIETMR